MRVLIIGSKDWSSYPEVMRQITLILEETKALGDDSVVFVHGGNPGAENMVTEYIGKVEKFLRQKGYSIKEELFKNSYQKYKSINDYKMIEAGADLGLVFTNDRDKRIQACVAMMQEFEIPTKIIRE